MSSPFLDIAVARNFVEEEEITQLGKISVI